MFKIRTRRIISGFMGVVLASLIFFSVPVNVHATDVAIGGDEVAIELLIQLAAAAFGTEVASDVMDYITLTPEMLNTGSYKYSDGTVIKNAGKYAASDVFVSSDTSLTEIEDIFDEIFSNNSSHSTPDLSAFPLGQYEFVSSPPGSLSDAYGFIGFDCIRNGSPVSAYYGVLQENEFIGIYFFSNDQMQPYLYSLDSDNKLKSYNNYFYGGNNSEINSGIKNPFFSGRFDLHVSECSGASVDLYGNVLLIKEVSSGVFYYTALHDGSIIGSGYRNDDGSFSISGSSINYNNGQFSDFFSAVSSSISKVGDFIKTDPNAINTAYHNYNTSSKTEADYAAYIAALNDALAASTAAQEEVSQDVKGIAGAMSTVLTWLQKIWSILSLIPTSLASIISLVSTIVEHVIAWDFDIWIQSIIDSIIALPNTIVAAFADFINDAAVFWEDILDLVQDIIEGILALPQNIRDSFSEFCLDAAAFWENICGIAQNIADGIQALPQNIRSAFQTFCDAAAVFWENICGIAQTIVDTISEWALVSWLTQIVEGIASIINAVLSIPDAICDYLDYLFVLDAAAEDRISDQVEEVFAPVLWIKDFVDTVKVAFIRIFKPQPNPPKIPIHLENATSQYNYGDTVYIDFAFWQPYKQIADPIIVAFCWAVFLWHAFKTIPGLISGSDGLIGNDSDNWSDKYDAFMWSHDYRAWEAHHNK